MRRGLQIFMTILMLMAIYCTFKYRVLPSSVINIEKKHTIVIDPGHGGVDPGKVGVDGSLEKDINLNISMKIKKILIDNGYEVVLTRDEDIGLYKESDSNKKSADMKARCKVIEEAEADLVISIHQNSFEQESVRGAQVFYYENSPEGKKLAECIQNGVRELADATNDRSVKANSSYYMLLHTPCPTVIVECGFMSNSNEAKLLGTDEYQEKLALAVCKGIEDYFGEEDVNKASEGHR